MKIPGIEYLTSEQLTSNKTPVFDIIRLPGGYCTMLNSNIAGKALPIVLPLKSGAMVLIVEHGFLARQHSFLNKKLYYIFNAIFDIVA